MGNAGSPGIGPVRSQETPGFLLSRPRGHQWDREAEACVALKGPPHESENKNSLSLLLLKFLSFCFTVASEEP